MSLYRNLISLRSSAAPSIARVIARPASATLVRPSAKLLTAVRSFTQSRPLLQAVTPSQPAKKDDAVAAAPQTFSDIVQKYGGWYPFLGLAGVIAVTKEVIILNEEFLLVSNFATMFGVLYLTMGDVLTKAAEEQRAEIHKKHDDISDFQIEQLQAVVLAHELNIEQVEVLKKLKTEHNSLSAEVMRVKALKLRHAARDAVVKRLGEVKSREASERASFKEVVGTRATAYVKRQFAAAPANVKAQLVDFAIDVVEGKKKQLDAKADPVKKLYADYFNNKIYEQELKQKQ